VCGELPEESEMSNDEVRERQRAELDFVTAAYSPEEAWITHDEPINKVHRVLHLPLPKLRDDSKTINSSISIKLELSMPLDYLADEYCTLVIDASLYNSASGYNSWRKVAIDSIPNLLSSLRLMAIESAGQETLFLVLSRAEEWVDVEWQEIVSSIESRVGNDIDLCHSRPPEHEQGGVILARKLIYSHHIIAKSKRKAIADLSREHHLGGYAKIGWPGIIIVEGEETGCDLFIDEIRSMRWQHLAVRGEEIVPVDDGANLNDLRCFPAKMVELAEDQMSELAEICRDAGLEALFKTSMKIYVKEEVDNDGGNKDDEKSEEDVYGAMIYVDHMNDRKGYEKWIRKACKSSGCSQLIIRCYKNDSNSSRPCIIVSLFGDESCVKQVMKRWRISRVDVDSKGTPCLERMMTVIIEGIVIEATDLHEILQEAKGVSKVGDDKRRSNKDAQEIFFSIGGSDWRDAMLNYIS